MKHTAIGTVCYVPPQVFLNQKYSDKMDIWAIGLILYEIIFQRIAFIGEDTEDIFQLIITATN
jgi:serine/threonine-protein kinase ULK/ATG1